MIRNHGVGLGFALFLLGCVNQNTWTPTVDSYGDPNAYRLSHDEAQCRQLALQASGGSARKTAEGALFGGLGGGAAGAAIGAAAGNAGMGAAVGAAAVGIGAAAYEGLETNQRFKSDFEQCLRERGHKVLQSRGTEPRSNVWPT
jgi:outer membrane lipoprotein SlyB